MGHDLKNWDPENAEQWASTGKQIANRNLWFSIPCLLCGFAVWLYWGIITVQMLNLGFPIDKGELFTLMGIAGLSGATLRIPSTFLIRMAGGRNVIFLTTALLILPAAGTGFLLTDITTPLWQFQIMALLCGFGGGNFASSMSNISFFYPKKVQGYSLGMNAGLGNFGVTTMQLLIPLVMTVGMFGTTALVLKTGSGTFLQKIPAGTDAYISNAGFVWVVILVPLVIGAWFAMNNIVDEHVSPNIGGTLAAFGKILGMLVIGLVIAALGLLLMLPETKDGLSFGIGINRWLILPGVIVATVFALKILTPASIKSSLDRQYKIFNNKHTWAMTIIYTMTFGSFIGFAAAFGLAIKLIFGYKHLMVDGVMNHDVFNTAGPSALMWAWTGPFIGALIRPLGGMIADKWGGALVTQIVSVIMIASTLGVAYFMKQAYASETPQDFFVPFLILFLVLFAATGIGNGSTFRTIAMVFDKEQAGPALGWTSAVAAYGAFIIPIEFKGQIKSTTPEYALYGFAAFYCVCIIINWWFYLRKNAYVKNP